MTFRRPSRVGPHSEIRRRFREPRQPQNDDAFSSDPKMEAVRTVLISLKTPTCSLPQTVELDVRRWRRFAIDPRFVHQVRQNSSLRNEEEQ